MPSSQTELLSSPGPHFVSTRRGAAGALHVLIVEDDPSVREVCAEMAASHGCEVNTTASLAAARTFLQQRSVDLAFLDLRLPGGTGTDLFEEIRSRHPRTLVVIMTAYASVTTAVDLMRDGAFDFLQKPFGLDRISNVLERADVKRKGSERSRALQDKLAAGLGSGPLIGTSAAMLQVFRIISKVAMTRHPVLLQGESGTGKELVARTIHASGPHPASPFVPVDCNPLAPEALAEELFGTVGGSAAATRHKPGVLVQAGLGTVYLNEVGSLSAALQRKLLRAIEDRKVGTEEASAGTAFESRILASSSRDLERLVETGSFRRDLYHRLCIIHLRLPPLRERSEDIPLLANAFLEREVRRHGTPFTFSDDALRSMTEYTWTGNVGELEAVVERIGALATGPVVGFEDLTTQVQAYMRATEERTPEPTEASAAVQEIPTMQQMEKLAIQRSLKEFQGDKLQAAKALGIGKTTLYRKLKEYGIAEEPA